MKQHFELIISVLLVPMLLSGCLSKEPDNAIVDKEDEISTITSVDEADQAVMGIYAAFKSSALYSGYLTLLPDIQADLVYAVDGFSNTYGDIWRWEIVPTNTEIESVYAALYTIIGRCNYFFENVAKLEPTITDDTQLDELQSLKGEAYFARALCYSELIKLFCKAYDPATAEDELGVVLISSYYHPETLTRSSLKESYDFVMADLDQAEELIELENTNNSAYFTKSTVNALRARNYLYMQDWSNALKYSTEVIDDDALSLSSASEMITSQYTYYQYMWKMDAATEIIWKVGFTTTSYGGALGRVFLNYDNVSYKPDYVPAMSALSLYEDNDNRYSAFFRSTTTGYSHHLTWPLLIKYEGNLNFTSLNILHVNMPKVFRLSEQYLIRAEAYCRLGDYSKASADITTLRIARYSSYGSATLTADNWLQTISEERVRELYMEGFRLQDLKRWHMGFTRTPQSNSVSTGSSLVVEADDPLFVWPIPQHELDAPGAEIQPNESNN